MGIKLSDGRANLWQWDTGRHVSVDTAAREIHFSREGARSSHTVQIEDGKAKIPDHMLVTAGKLIAYVVEEDENGEMTVFKQLFDVLRRPKPEDYIYTEQEIKRWEQLEQRVDALEKEGIGDHTKLTNRDTADQHPIWAITGLSDALDNNSTAVLTATKTAQDAATAAGKAQTTADNAQTAANRAQSTADAANATAEGLDSRITAAENELSQKQPAGDYLTEETDPTVPTWAKQPQKPTYTATEVGALPRDTKIPSKVSELENDEKYAKTSELPQIDATLKQSGQAADAAETGKRIEAISPDDSTIDGKPWSSKQIIDTLCPPLEETGNPVQCYPVAGYPLGCKVSWEPTQAGSGEPSLDNIRSIVGRTSVQVSRYEDELIIPLTFDETIYGGELDAVTGSGQGTWKLLTLDGTEKWNVDGKYLDDKSDWYYVSGKIAGAINAPPLKGNDICSHYPHADVANNNAVKGCAIVWGAVRVRWGDTIPDNADTWKTYLAAQYATGTPVQVAYKLATPTSFEATGVQPIEALHGVNTVLTDADSVTVTGRADPIKRITDLEDAAASMTTTEG